MPPIKGKMMGRMGGSIMDFKSLKDRCNTIEKRKPPKPTKVNLRLQGEIEKDEELKKLRIPMEICQVLPSVKKFHGSKNYVDLTDEASKETDDDVYIVEDKSGLILGSRKGRGNQNVKYQIQQIAETKYNSMIWDIQITPNSEKIVLSCNDGTFMCDLELKQIKQLKNVTLGGGISFFKDHQMVVLCRITDTINIFTEEGEFVRAITLDIQAVNVDVNSKDQMIVTDPGQKVVKILERDGTVVKTLPTEGKGYVFKWPLYARVCSDDSFFIGDGHSQKVLHFKANGQFMKEISLKTYSGNQILRPHGMCFHDDNDLLIVDKSIETIEVFSSGTTYLQTLVPSDLGQRLKPKVLASSCGMLVIGGMKGLVHLYQFVGENGEEIKVKEEIEDTKIKMEVDDDGVVCLL